VKRTHLFFLFALVILSLTLFVIPASRARRSSETRAQRRQIKEFAQRALANAGMRPVPSRTICTIWSRVRRVPTSAQSVTRSKHHGVQARTY